MLFSSQISSGGGNTILSIIFGVFMVYIFANNVFVKDKFRTAKILHRKANMVEMYVMYWLPAFIYQVWNVKKKPEYLNMMNPRYNKRITMIKI